MIQRVRISARVFCSVCGKKRWYVIDCKRTRRDKMRRDETGAYLIANDGGPTNRAVEADVRSHRQMCGWIALLSLQGRGLCARGVMKGCR